MSDCSRDSVSKTAVEETLRKHLSTDIVYKFADLIRVKYKETCRCTEDGDITLAFVKRDWMCGYIVHILKDYDWKD